MRAFGCGCLEFDRLTTNGLMNIYCGVLLFKFIDIIASNYAAVFL